MRIDQLNSNSISTGGIHQSSFCREGEGVTSASSDKASGRGVVFSIDENRKLKKMGLGENDRAGEKKNSSDIAMAASGMDAVQMKNEMVVGAQTITSDEAKELENEGFSLKDDDIHTVITVTDKIRAAMAGAGSEPEAKADPSVIEADGKIAEGKPLVELPDTAKEYLIREELPPTVINVDQAISAGASSAGIYSGNDWSWDDIPRVIESALDRDMIPVTPENTSAAQWLIEREILVNYENIEYKKALDVQITVDGDNDSFVIQGYSVDDRAEAAYDTIFAVTDEELAVLIDRDKPITVENLKNAREWTKAGGKVPELDFEREAELIKAKRMLEETRLVMTIEANRSLIKSGMEIDTRELADLVSDLKTKENDMYRSMMDPKGEVTDEQVELFKTVLDAIEELKYAPAATIAVVDINDIDFASLHREAKTLSARYDAAGERYEALSTEVRKDLGDSINKAFQNVDDILEFLDMKRSEENQRAVRILGRNSMELSKENIENIKAADSLVMRTFDALKPAIVREMIKQNINPMSMNMEELKNTAESIRESLPVFDETEKFSKYLWRLEHSGDIAPDERDSYIGIYRLITQVSKNDFAAIGAVVDTGRELNMENLLTAVRTANKGSMDYMVDDDFEGVKATSKGRSISDQVQTAFSMINDLMSGSDVMGGGYHGEESGGSDPDSSRHSLASTVDQLKEEISSLLENTKSAPEMEKTDDAYYGEILSDMKRASAAAEEVYRALETYEVIPSVDNTIVMEQMMNDPGLALKRIFALNKDDFKGRDEIIAELEDIKEDILDAFGEHVKNPSELAEALETLASVAEHCGQTFEREGMTSLDVRQMQLACKQLSVTSNMARYFHYNVPVMTEQGVTNVSFKVLPGATAEEAGTVSVFMESEDYGRISAKLTVTEGEVKGYIASDSRAGADALKRRINELPGRIDVMFARDVKDMSYGLANGDGENEASLRNLFNLATDIVKFLRKTS